MRMIKVQNDGENPIWFYNDRGLSQMTILNAIQKIIELESQKKDPALVKQFKYAIYLAKRGINSEDVEQTMNSDDFDDELFKEGRTWYGVVGESETTLASSPVQALLLELYRRGYVGKYDLKTTLDRIEWPIRIYEFEPEDLRSGLETTRPWLTQRILDKVVEVLDSSFLFQRPVVQSGCNEVTELAAQRFTDVMTAEYKPWRKVNEFTYSREDVERLEKEGRLESRA